MRKILLILIIAINTFFVPAQKNDTINNLIFDIAESSYINKNNVDTIKQSLTAFYKQNRISQSLFTAGAIITLASALDNSENRVPYYIIGAACTFLGEIFYFISYSHLKLKKSPPKPKKQRTHKQYDIDDTIIEWR